MLDIEVTPWKWHKDLVKVRNQLYHRVKTQPDERSEGVDTVAMWRIRGNLPHVVESTAMIVDVMLSDEAGLHRSRFNIQAAYASAFCRFVTGMCDAAQTGRRKKSMFQAAEEIGLPEYFVELRHEATHEELPNVSELRRASDEALVWLWNYYWKDLE